MSQNKQDNINASSDVAKFAKVLPKHINLDKWKDSGYVWEGKVVPSSLTRLVDVVPQQYQENPFKLKCELEKRGQLLMLTMSFVGEVWVVCQRCLQPVAYDITHDFQLILLQNEEQESLVDDDDDYLLLDELLDNDAQKPNADRMLPLAELVEDEIILYIPTSAKHDDCEMAVQQVGEIVEEEADNPFAVLEALKGKL